MKRAACVQWGLSAWDWCRPHTQMLYIQDEASMKAAEDGDVKAPEDSGPAAELFQEGGGPAARVRRPRKSRRDRDRRRRRR